MEIVQKLTCVNCNATWLRHVRKGVKPPRNFICYKCEEQKEKTQQGKKGELKYESRNRSNSRG